MTYFLSPESTIRSAPWPCRWRRTSHPARRNKSATRDSNSACLGDAAPWLGSDILLPWPSVYYGRVIYSGHVTLTGPVLSRTAGGGRRERHREEERNEINGRTRSE